MRFDNYQEGIIHQSHRPDLRAIIAIVIAVLLLLGYEFYKETDETSVSSGPVGSIEALLNNEQIKQAPLALHMLEVGKADCLLLRAGDAYVLVDSGNRPDKAYIQSYLQAEGVEKLQLVVATHPHEDHIGSMGELLDVFPVEEVWLSPRTHTTTVYEKLLDSIERNNVDVTIPSPGTRIDLNGVLLEVLAPLDEYEDINNCSIVIKVTYQENTLLLTGDIEKKAEKHLIAEYGEALQVDLLKVPHHGSNTSSHNAFLTAVAPEIAFIPCDENDESVTPPSDKVLERLTGICTLYRTDRNGACFAITDGHTLRIFTER